MEARTISSRSFASEVSDAHTHSQKPCSVPLRYTHHPTPSQAHEVCAHRVTWEPPMGRAGCSRARALSQVPGSCLMRTAVMHTTVR